MGTLTSKEVREIMALADDLAGGRLRGYACPEQPQDTLKQTQRKRAKLLNYLNRLNPVMEMRKE